MSDQYEALLENYERLQELIDKLDRDIMYETRVEEKARMKNELSEKKEELNNLAKRMEEAKLVSKKMEISKLERILLQLNYYNHTRSFRKCMDKMNAAAFLIHGQIGGPVWLLKNLLKVETLQIISNTEIKFSFSSRRTFRTDIKALWAELARYLQLSPSSCQEDIETSLIRRLRTQNVIIIIDRIEACKDKKYLSKVIKEFWQPLANSVTQSSHYNNKKLIMFLLEQEEYGLWRNLEYLECCSERITSCFLIKLPEIKPFSEKELNDWIRFVYRDLPDNFINYAENTEVIAKKIIENSEGIPERVLKEVYNLCEHDWYEVAELWELI